MFAAPPSCRRASLSVEQRVADLLGRMTLEEKIDQLHQCGLGDANPSDLAVPHMPMKQIRMAEHWRVSPQVAN